ncbi:MAG: hypothetical protein ACOZQL_28855 [Myxococcota bacterium]
MKRALVVVLSVASLAWAQEAAPAAEEAAKPAAPVEAKQEAAAPAVEPSGCQAWRAKGLGEGPVALGYAEADVATGRRACPRTELGLGGRFGAIIDTPDFYGNLAVNGLLFGSYALRDTTELFATLEAINFNFAQNAVLTSTQLTLGNLTAGATQVLFRGERWVGAVSGRVLLPTSFEIPGARLLGGELGASASWRPTQWLEVHGYVGGDLSGAIGRGPSLVRGGALLLAGAQLSPFDWGALVVDLSGRFGPLTYFAPTFALRFKISELGVELGGTLPLAGTDRHDFIAGLRVNWRFN